MLLFYSTSVKIYMLMLQGSSKEADSVKESSRTEKASMFAKRAALLQHRKPTSSVEADITGGTAVGSQALPKPEISTASSKNYTFKKGTYCLLFANPTNPPPPPAVQSKNGNDNGSLL